MKIIMYNAGLRFTAPKVPAGAIKFKVSELTKTTVQLKEPITLSPSTSSSLTYPFVKIKNNKITIHADNIVVDDIVYTPRLRVGLLDNENYVGGLPAKGESYNGYITNNDNIVDYTKVLSGWDEGAFDENNNCNIVFTESVKSLLFTVMWLQQGTTTMDNVAFPYISDASVYVMYN